MIGAVLDCGLSTNMNEADAKLRDWATKVQTRFNSDNLHMTTRGGVLPHSVSSSILCGVLYCVQQPYTVCNSSIPALYLFQKTDHAFVLDCSGVLRQSRHSTDPVGEEKHCKGVERMVNAVQQSHEHQREFERTMRKDMHQMKMDRDNDRAMIQVTCYIILCALLLCYLLHELRYPPSALLLTA